MFHIPSTSNSNYDLSSVKILDHVADLITFGALEPCPKCHDGRFTLANSSYVCNGKRDEWANCGNVQREPIRNAVIFPGILKMDFPFLESLFNERKVQTRLLKPPLYNMEFVIIGDLEQSQDDIEKKIQRMGGKLGSKIHDKLAAIISTEEKIIQMDLKMTEAKNFGIQVVSEEFLEMVKSGGAISYITSKSICNWGTDVSIPSSNFWIMNRT